MKILLLLWLSLSLLSGNALAQVAGPSGPAVQQPTSPDAALTFYNRNLITFRGEMAGISAEDRAQRLVDALNQPFALRDGEARIGTSVGIAMYPAHGTTADQLMEFADAALYFAKHAGRNCVLAGAG